MSSTNPFDPLHEVDKEEGLFPGADSLRNVETNPPRNYELMRMNNTSETGDRSTPTSTDRTQPSDPIEWTTYTTNGPLTHSTGDGTGPSAPPPQNTLYPQIHSAQNIVSKEVERVASSEEYRSKIEQAKEQLNKHFKELQQKLDDHHKKLLEELDSSYERNLPLIKEREKEITELSETEGKERIKVRAKQTILEQKKEAIRAMMVLTDVKVCYKPHLQGNLEEILTVITHPANDNQQLQLDNSREAFMGEEQTPNSPPKPAQSPASQRHATTPRGTLPPGPIVVNVRQGNIPDPVGLVIDRKNNDVIYVADKGVHQVLVFDRSGCSLKTITHREMMNPHSLGVSEKFLFTLCAGNSEDLQFLLKFDKISGSYWGKLPLKNMRHIPLSVNEEKIYMATSSERVEMFNLNMEPCRKIEIKLERRSGAFFFHSDPEVRDICVKMQILYLLVLNAKCAVQGFSLEGVLQFSLATSDQLTDPRFFTVDTRGVIYVTEWKEGKVKQFMRNGTHNVYDSVKVETGSEMISKPMGIDVDSKGKIVLCCAQREWILKEF